MKLQLLPIAGAAGGLAIAGMGVALLLARIEASGLRKDLTIAQALHAGDIARFEADQALADAEHQAAIAAMKDDYRRNKDEADLADDRRRADYGARVMQLAAAQADNGRAAAPSVSGTGGAPGADRSGGDSVLLARSDALICAINTGRLQSGHDWALGLGAAAQ